MVERRTSRKPFDMIITSTIAQRGHHRRNGTHDDQHLQPHLSSAARPAVDAPVVGAHSCKERIDPEVSVTSAVACALAAAAAAAAAARQLLPRSRCNTTAATPPLDNVLPQDILDELRRTAPPSVQGNLLQQAFAPIFTCTSQVVGVRSRHVAN